MAIALLSLVPKFGAYNYLLFGLDAGMRSGGLTSALRLRVCGGGLDGFGGDLPAQPRHEQLDDLAVFRR